MFLDHRTRNWPCPCTPGRNTSTRSSAKVCCKGSHPNCYRLLQSRAARSKGKNPWLRQWSPGRRTSVFRSVGKTGPRNPANAKPHSRRAGRSRRCQQSYPQSSDSLPLQETAFSQPKSPSLSCCCGSWIDLFLNPHRSTSCQAGPSRDVCRFQLASGLNGEPGSPHVLAALPKASSPSSATLANNVTAGVTDTFAQALWHISEVIEAQASGSCSML